MGDKQAVEPATLPTPDRPWSHGSIPSGQPLYISGQTSVDSNGNVLHQGSLYEQFTQALENVEQVVTAANGSISDVASVTIYVTDMDAWRDEAVGDVRNAFFEEPYPSSTLVAVTELGHPDWLVEVEAIAYLSE